MDLQKVMLSQQKSAEIGSDEEQPIDQTWIRTVLNHDHEMDQIAAAEDAAANLQGANMDSSAPRRSGFQASSTSGLASQDNYMPRHGKRNSILEDLENQTIDELLAENGLPAPEITAGSSSDGLHKRHSQSSINQDC